MLKLFHGKDKYLSLKASQTAFKTLQNEFPDHEVVIIDCDMTTSEEVAQGYQTAGLFSSGKNVLLKRVSGNSDKEMIIEDFKTVAAEDTSNTNIIIWEDSKVAANTKYFKFFKENNAIEESPQLNKRTFVTWAKEEVVEMDVDIEGAALNELIQLCNYESEKFINELGKLKLAGKKKITVEDVKESSIDTLEQDIWMLIDSINGRNDTPPAVIIDNLLRQKQDPIYILIMIVRNTRQIILTKYLVDKGYQSKEIASELRIPPFTVPTLIKAANNMSDAKLKGIYKKLYSLDFEIKTGRIDPQMGITLISTIL